MVMNVADALSAYRQGGGLSSSIGSGSVGAAGTGTGSFSEALKEFGLDAVGSLKAGESAAVAGATGKASMATVVTAINNAEMVLQEVVTLRDKVIAAYQDISKTAI